MTTFKSNAHALWDTLHSQLLFMRSVGLDVDEHLAHFPQGDQFYDLIDVHLQYVVPGAVEWTNSLAAGNRSSRPSAFGLPIFKPADESGGIYLIEETPGQRYGGAGLKHASDHPFAALLVCRPQDRAVVWSDADWGLYTGQADRVTRPSGGRVVNHDDKLATGTSRSVRDVFQAGLVGRAPNEGPVTGSRKYCLYFNLPRGYDSKIKLLLEAFVASHTAWRSDMGATFADDVGHEQATPICSAVPLNGRHVVLTDFDNEGPEVAALCRALNMLGDGCAMSGHPLRSVSGRQAFGLPSSSQLEGDDCALIKIVVVHDRRLLVDVATPPVDDFWPRFATLKDDREVDLSPAQVLPLRYAWKMRRQAARWFRHIVKKHPALLQLDNAVFDHASQVADKLVDLSIPDAMLACRSVALCRELGLDPRRAQVVRALVYVRKEQGALTAIVYKKRSDTSVALPDDQNGTASGDDSDDAGDEREPEHKSRVPVFLHRLVPYDESSPKPEHVDIIRIDGQLYGQSDLLTGSSAVSLDWLISTKERAQENRENFLSIITSRCDRIASRAPSVKLRSSSDSRTGANPRWPWARAPELTRAARTGAASTSTWTRRRTTRRRRARCPSTWQAGEGEVRPRCVD